MSPWVVWCCLLGGHPAAAAQAVALGNPTYQLQKAPRDVREFAKRFSPEQLRVLEALNRADAGHLPTLPVLVVPDSWQADLRAYSPFPLTTVAWGSDFPKLLIVHQPGQAFAAYEHGHLIRWGPVSSGRRLTPTPEGLFHLNWRSPGRHSTVDSSWFMPWYFNFQNDRGISFHEYTLPGRPASHACVRLLEPDARWLFDWGESWMLDARGQKILKPGTAVLIAGCYDFGNEPPWRSMAWLATSIQLPSNPNVEQRDCASARQLER